MGKNCQDWAKTERNPNAQIPSPLSGAAVGTWGLGIHWDLGFGVWDFMGAIEAPSSKTQ